MRDLFDIILSLVQLVLDILNLDILNSRDRESGRKYSQIQTLFGGERP